MDGHSQSTPARRNPLTNKNGLIAFGLGVVFLLVSHFGAVTYPFWSEVVREVGFALIVAVIIWVTYEFSARAETDALWNERLEKIATNVFFGVFKKNFPPEFIREANILVLEHEFIRKDLHLTYTLTDSTFVNREGDQQVFVVLNAVARYKMQNVGNSKASAPIAIGLPNPLINEMKQKCRVHRVSVKRHGEEKRLELDKAEGQYRVAMEDDGQSQVPFTLESVPVDPGEEIELIFDYSMAKEEEDTEIFQTKFPTDSVTITIMDKGPTRRAIRARSIHHEDLEDDTSASLTGVYSFKLDRFLLPHQGFAIWWKKVPPATLEQHPHLRVGET